MRTFKCTSLAAAIIIGGFVWVTRQTSTENASVDLDLTNSGDSINCAD